MIPALVADEIRETVLDYPRTTWALSNRDLETALFRFLEGKDDPATGIFKGPYLTLRLPFAPKPPDAPIPFCPETHRSGILARSPPQHRLEPAAIRRHGGEI